MGDFEPHLDAPSLLGGHLVTQQAVEEFEIGRLRARGLVEHGVDALGEIAEREPTQMLDDAGVDEVAHRTPPSTMRA